jgi:mono/diheme cytochrome c family protein
MKATWKILPLIVAALLVGACGSARRSEPIIGESAARGPAFAEGRRLFMQHCHTCHPGGEAGLGPAINNKPLPAGLIKFQVRHGLGAMPAFKADHLENHELDAIAAYLIALRSSK